MPVYAAGDYVFGRAEGSRVGDSKTAWTASCRRAHIAGLRFHDLRHEAGSRKLEAGYPMHAVALWLGHTDLTTTARDTRGPLVLFSQVRSVRLQADLGGSAVRLKPDTTTL